MKLVETMPMAEALDPRIGSRGNWISYLGLPTPQYTQIFRSKLVLGWTGKRPSNSVVRLRVLESYERHIEAIGDAFENGAGFEGSVRPEGSEESMPFRVMYGVQRFRLMVPEAEHWHPALIALKGRALRLIGPTRQRLYDDDGYGEVVAYDMRSAVYEWLSELALGFHEDGREYNYPTLNEWKTQAMLDGKFHV
jgi:hypothetical protein